MSSGIGNEAQRGILDKCTNAFQTKPYRTADYHIFTGKSASRATITATTLWRTTVQLNGAPPRGERRLAGWQTKKICAARMRSRKPTRSAARFCPTISRLLSSSIAISNCRTAKESNNFTSSFLFLISILVTSQTLSS